MRLFLRNRRVVLMATASFLAASGVAPGQSDLHRGLWVGQVNLNYVNEVPVPLDENDVPIAPDPKVPTPTSDQAQLRVILHVNGAGQVTLLRDVAVLNRRPIAELDATATAAAMSGVAVDSDLALVTDPGLYGAFPPQPAVRIASVAFDFGDARATAALDEVVARVAEAVAGSVGGSTENVTTQAGRQAATSAAVAAAQAASSPAVTEADASAAFERFLRDNFQSADVDAIAAAANPALEAQDERADAVALLGASFYGDSRAVEMVDAVVAAVQAATTPVAKRADAQNMAAAYADVADTYHRFIAGKVFGDMMAGAATTAATAAVEAGATTDTIRLAVSGNAAVVAARREALTGRIARYVDTRATLAVEVVITAVLNTVNAALPDVPGSAAALEAAALEAGRAALAGSVVRYPISPQRPSAAYDTFVASDGYQASPQTAAGAAAAAAVSERANNALYTADSLRDAARVAAVTALQSAYSDAARTQLTELPLQGSLGAGKGDPRRAFDIQQAKGSPLGPPGLSGEIFLPANHPTNPFRHRQNPDHRIGYDVTRLVRWDFDATPGNTPGSASLGVARLTGMYREEIRGLHKPLGPNRDTGLKVEGRFELRRISLIDALNAR